MKNLNKLVNHDMKQLNNWLSANKISLNVEKTEPVIFKSQRKLLSDEIKIKLTGKRLYISIKLSKISCVRTDTFFGLFILPRNFFRGRITSVYILPQNWSAGFSKITFIIVA